MGWLATAGRTPQVITHKSIVGSSSAPLSTGTSFTHIDWRYSILANSGSVAVIINRFSVIAKALDKSPFKRAQEFRRLLNPGVNHPIQQPFGKAA